MITPGNYCVHAVEDIRRFCDQLERNLVAPHSEVVYMRTLCNSVLEAEKFILPDNGRLMDFRMQDEDRVRNLRIPFKKTAVEVSIRTDNDFIVKILPGQEDCPRRILYCEENQWQTGYTFTSIDWLAATNQWQPCPFSMFVPYDNSLSPVDLSGVPAELAPYFKDRKAYGIKCTYTTEMPKMFDMVCKLRGMHRGEMEVRTRVELSSDWNMVVDLTNVLSCSNVVTEAIDPSAALNKKRIKSGKLPFFSYKVLTVKERTSTSMTGFILAGKRNSPRQHVRRGHIRVYHRGESNERRVWINQMIVGDQALGTVSKDYRVER